MCKYLKVDKSSYYRWSRNGCIVKKVDEKLNELRAPLITCSFGVIDYIENDTVETLMNRVDKKVYKAKQNGRNIVEF